MSELAFAIVGALVGSLATLLWEAFLRPRAERKSMAAALNSKVAFNLLMLDRYQEGNPEAVEEIPRAFSAATTVYKSLASRLGELPPDLSFLLATHYSALEAANEFPRHYAELESIRRAGGPESASALSEQRRLARGFYQLLGSARASCGLVHSELGTIASSVMVQISSEHSSGDRHS